ncbi:MAG: N-acetylmuramoyl-L-alanine amidase [Gammaproteobacteria bacterium]|jgi:N-acetylmuramoyl-L-alanine amidase
MPQVIKDSNIKYIAVHCSATPPSRDIGAAEIDAAHKARGFGTPNWSGEGQVHIGYHWVIRRDGRIERGRYYNQRGAHVKGFNDESIGVCMVGGVNSQLLAENNFTDEQFKSLYMLLQVLERRYGKNVKVMGHRDFPRVAKECPCFNVQVWYKDTKTRARQAAYGGGSY